MRAKKKVSEPTLVVHPARLSHTIWHEASIGGNIASTGGAAGDEMIRIHTRGDKGGSFMNRCDLVEKLRALTDVLAYGESPDFGSADVYVIIRRKTTEPAVECTARRSASGSSSRSRRAT